MQRAPTWVHVLINGGLFFALSTVLNGLRGGGWTVAATSGLLGGVIFGLLVGPVSARRIRRAGAVTSDLSDAATRRAHRAALRGPVPDDAVMRAAAADLARQQCDDVSRFRIVGVVLFTGTAVLSVWLAATVTSPWFWFSAVLFLGLVAQQLWYPRHLARRVDRLESGQEGAAGRSA